MKLHLPKVLLAAVVAVLGLQYASAGTEAEANVTLNDNTYNVTWYVGNTNNNINLGGITFLTDEETGVRCDTLGFKMTGDGNTTGNWFNKDGASYANTILVSRDAKTAEGTYQGLIIDNGSGSQKVTFAGTVLGNGDIAKLASPPSSGMTIAFTGNMAQYTGNMYIKGNASNKFEFYGATSGTGIIDSVGTVIVNNATMNNSAITTAILHINGGTTSFAANSSLTVGSFLGTSGTLSFGEGMTLEYTGEKSTGYSLEHETFGYASAVDLLSGTITTNRAITVTWGNDEYTMRTDGVLEGASVDNFYHIAGNVNASTIKNSGDDLTSVPGYSLDSGTLTLDEDFTITGTSTITATFVENAENATTAKLIIGSGTTSVNSNNGQNLKSNIEIAAGATLEFLGTGPDAIAYSQTNRTITVAGTMDVGTTRQTVGNWTFDLKGGTIQGAGQASQNNVGLDFHAAGNINAKALEGATAAAPTVSTISTKVRMNGALNVDVASNARLDVTGAIVGNKKLTKTGNGTLRLQNDANTYNVIDVTGGLLEVRDNAVTMNSAVTVKDGAEMRLQRESGSATLADVVLNDGSLLSQAKSDTSGVADMTITNLTVGENGGTVGTVHDDVYGHSYNGTISIGSLSADSDSTRTLKLVAAHNLSSLATISLNGGAVEGKQAFHGTVNVGIDSSDATRNLDLKIAHESVLEKAVVLVGNADKDINSYHINLKLAADTVKLAGIKDIDGRLSQGDVAKDDSVTVSTLSINTGTESFSTKYRVTGGINMVKDGTGTQSFGGNMSEFGSASGTEDGHIEVKGGVLQFSNESGTLTAESLTLTGGMLDVDGSLTLNALSLDLSKYATTQLEYELVSAGTLSLGEKVNLQSLGASVGEYTATVTQRGHSLWLTYKTTPEDLGTLEVSTAVLTGDVLTLNIDANLTDVSELDLTLSAAALASIEGKFGLVSLELIANDGTFYTIGDSNVISNVSFYGSYVGEGGKYRVEYIPEPATATLSLLALAGLAARRRRK